MEESERVRAWRYRLLREVGYSIEEATKMASDPEVDVHAVADEVRRLRGRGVPDRLALEMAV